MQRFLTVIITAFIACKSFAQNKTNHVTGCGISITSPDFNGRDSATWCDPSIRSWRPRGGDNKEQRFIIRGTATNPPEGGYITLSVIVDKEYGQPGRFEINSDGAWVGELFLRTSDGISRDKTIVVYVNSEKREITNKCEFIIQSCK
jgi:hypothetical protein